MGKSIVWITGASSGIGEAAAKKFSKEGYALILSSRNVSELERVKESCAFPQDVRLLPLDLSETSSLPEKAATAIALFGGLDLLLHNGGISQRSLIKETQLEVDRRLMEVNYFGTVALTKAVLPYFIQNKKGHFAVVTSLVGKFGSPYRSSYAGAKHALHGFFDTLRAEHYQDNIAVTLICPGFIHTQVSVNAVTGDGSPLGEMDQAQAQGMSAEACADQLFRALLRKKEEVYIGGKETWAVYLKRFFPGIFSRILRKANVR
ncbi:MAG: SDR family oxidoreductase [Bacteroidota bacterium]|jgi:dehydrogenase/reductase SDR family protein 7B